MALEDPRGGHLVATTIEVDQDRVLVRRRVGSAPGRHDEERGQHRHCTEEQKESLTPQHEPLQLVWFAASLSRSSCRINRSTDAAAPGVGPKAGRPFPHTAGLPPVPCGSRRPPGPHIDPAASRLLAPRDFGGSTEAVLAVRQR